MRKRKEKKNAEEIEHGWYGCNGLARIRKEEMNVQHSTFNAQRRIKEILNAEKEELMGQRQGLYKSTSLKYRKVAPSRGPEQRRWIPASAGMTERRVVPRPATSLKYRKVAPSRGPEQRRWIPASVQE